MAIITTQELTLQIPSDLFDRLLKTAAFRHQSPERVITETLDLSLPAPADQGENLMDYYLSQLSGMSREQLKKRTQAHLNSTDHAHLEELLEQNKTTGLSSKEEIEAKSLLDKVEAIAAERAAAWLLLRNQQTLSE